MVIGASNTAMDCLRTARRLGTARCCVYRRSEAETPARAWRSFAMRAGGRAVLLPACAGGILLDDKGDVRGLKAQR